MINLDEYVRFRLLENKMRTYTPKKTHYQGVRVFLNTESSGPLEKYSYFFHPLFGTIVLYDHDNIVKTPLCEAIDKEIRDEYAIYAPAPVGGLGAGAVVNPPAVKVPTLVPRNLPAKLRGLWFLDGI